MIFQNWWFQLLRAVSENDLQLQIRVPDFPKTSRYFKIPYEIFAIFKELGELW